MRARAELSMSKMFVAVMRCRTDDNQTEIVDALRRVGCSVQSLADIGQGCPDLLIGHPVRGLFLLEVKDGNKSPSRRKRTMKQVIWHAEWKWPVHVVNSVDEALEAVGIRI